MRLIATNYCNTLMLVILLWKHHTGCRLPVVLQEGMLERSKKCHALPKHPNYWNMYIFPPPSGTHLFCLFIRNITLSTAETDAYGCELLERRAWLVVTLRSQWRSYFLLQFGVIRNKLKDIILPRALRERYLSPPLDSLLNI